MVDLLKNPSLLQLDNFLLVLITFEGFFADEAEAVFIENITHCFSKRSEEMTLSLKANYH